MNEPKKIEVDVEALRAVIADWVRPTGAGLHCFHNLAKALEAHDAAEREAREKERKRREAKEVEGWRLRRSLSLSLPSMVQVGSGNTTYRTERQARLQVSAPEAWAVVEAFEAWDENCTKVILEDIRLLIEKARAAYNQEPR